MLHSLSVVGETDRGSWQLAMLVDDLLNAVYIDGLPHYVPPSNYSVIKRFRVPQSAKLLAVNVSDNGVGFAGLAAGMENGMVTDSLWKCINATESIPTNWMSLDFDDSSWPAAVVNDKAGPRLPYMRPTVTWIWTSSISSHTKAGWFTNILCRRTLNGKCDSH